MTTKPRITLWKIDEDDLLEITKEFTEEEKDVIRRWNNCLEQVLNARKF